MYNDRRRSLLNNPESRRAKNETCVSFVLAEGVRVTRIRIMSTKVDENFLGEEKRTVSD